MIVDLPRFVEAGRPRWVKLEERVKRLESDPEAKLSLEEIQEFHALYQHACASLARIAPLSSEPELKRYLEWLVGRAYCEIHAAAERKPFSFRQWLFGTFPRAFRSRVRAFQLSVALTLLGALFGALAMALDADAKSVLMPFGHLQTSPKERVAKEMVERGRSLAGNKGRFSAQLMTHNIRVSFLLLAAGMTFGIGTFLGLFYNGAILGAVVFDYVAGGQTPFLLGWLLPHGAVEIPAIVIAGQAGLVLGHALIGHGSRQTLPERMRAATPDLVALAGGIAVMLVWAGIVEAFFSQYHEPVLPYAVKITFGVLEGALLTVFLMRSGRRVEAA